MKPAPKTRTELASWIVAAAAMLALGLNTAAPVDAGEPPACPTPAPYVDGWMIIGTDLHGCTIIEPFTLAGEGSATAPLTIPNTAMRAWDRLR